MTELEWIAEEMEVAAIGVFRAGDVFHADDRTAENLIRQGCARVPIEVKPKEKKQKGNISIEEGS